MFDSLSDKFDNVFRKIRGTDKLSEANVEDALREVKLALLEADVHFKVVKDFVKAVKEGAVGREVVKGVNPTQQFVSVVHDELVKMLRGTEEDRPFELVPGKEQAVLLLGLQGAGKTTFSGKLALHLEKLKMRPMLVACDIYRPAAIEQLKTVGKALSIPVFEMGTGHPPHEIVAKAREKARAAGRDVLIVDTAGRLHIDEVRMDELRELKERVRPDYSFLVCDAMTGQDVVNSAQTFHREIGIDGVCLTKMDGDARGGAALSVKAVTGRPIVFAGTGEKPTDLERFHPERVAQRILGMGDVVSLVEKAQEAIDEKEAADMQEKMSKGTFTFDDFIKQMRVLKKMGPLKGLLGMLPGVGRMLKDVDNDVLTAQLTRVESIIDSMTKEERRNGDLLVRSGTRRMRVAKGSGRTLQEVNDLVTQFQQMRQAMQAFSAGGLFGGGAQAPEMAGKGGMPPMPPDLPGEMPQPGDPMYDKLMKQYRDYRHGQKVAARFVPKAKAKKKR
ncbi:MAG: signal recognition particle protein [Candidatus Sumerlaeia bacterium]|nr:signal recognition particle protein [Candidatus Sumerlaeia bacterium]